VTDAASNNTPQANDDSVRTNTSTAVTFSVVANDTDADNNLLPASAAETSVPGHGSLTRAGSGSFSYTPAGDYTGPDSFTYRVCDGAGACDEAAVILYTGAERISWQDSTTYVAYEDLKNTGWSDWDYNDFVVRIDAGTGIDAAGRLVAVEVDYDALARGAGYAQRFVHNLPIEGGGLALLSVYESTGTLLGRRVFRFDGNTNFTIFDRTADALPPLAGFFDTNTRSAQSGIVPGRKAQLLVYLNNPDANPAVALPPPPWDPYIYVYYTRQEVHLPVPGHMDNTQIVNPARDSASPLVGYDLPLAQTFAVGWRWPEEFTGIWRGYPQFAPYMGSGGAASTGWWQPENALAHWLWSPGAQASAYASGSAGAQAGSEDAASTATVLSRYFGGPVAADLNGDGWTEIIAGNLLANRVEVMNVLGGQVGGWPRPTGGGVKAPPAVADLDGDGRLDILAGSETGEIYAWHANGQPLGGWPVVLHGGFRILATPAVGDIDADGALDVVVPAADGKLYALDAQGAPKAGWPVSIGDVADLYGSQVINGSPQLADLDGDGSREIVVGATDKRVYVFNRDGSTRWIFPTDDMLLSTPAVGEIDPTTAGLEIVVGSGDRYVYLLDAAGNLLWRRPTGWTIRSSPIFADLDGDGAVEILIGSDDNRVWAWHRDGTLVAGWPQTTGADVMSSPRVGDIDGDGDLEVVAGSDDARLWAWHADGTPVDGWPQAMNLSVKGAPLLVNLDDDPTLEVAAADLSGLIRKWQVGAVAYQLPVYLPLVTRGR
jgi:LruC domain-containing protein